eukprot:3480133-Amphidinium_carterae.4
MCVEERRSSKGSYNATVLALAQCGDGPPHGIWAAPASSIPGMEVLLRCPPSGCSALTSCPCEGAGSVRLVRYMYL